MFFFAINDESLIFIAIVAVYSHFPIYKGMNIFAKSQIVASGIAVAYLFLTKFFLSLVNKSI